MKTYKEFIQEALPPHLAKLVDKPFGFKDVTPSFKNFSLIVPLINRNEAISLLRKEKIRFTSRGSSSGELIFNDENNVKKAIDLFNQANIKIL